MEIAVELLALRLSEALLIISVEAQLEECAFIK